MEKTHPHTKSAKTHYDVHALITKRWSARSFSTKTIDEDILKSLFEAAAWTASSMNEQPWHFIYALKGTTGFDRMTEALMDGNKVWAKNGAVLIASLAKRNFERNGSINRHAMHDVGAANTTLLLQAAQHDIFGHMMGGFHMDEANKVLGINPGEYEIACFIVLGYLDDPEKLDEPFRTRETSERTRKPLESIIEVLES